MAPASDRHERSRNPNADLRPLLEFSTVINASLDVEFILNTLLLTVMGKLMVTKGMVLTRIGPSAFRVVTAKGLGASLIGTELACPRPARGIVNLNVPGRTASDWRSFFRERGQDLVAPILSGRKILGYLSVGGRMTRRPFAQTDRQLLQSMLNLSASAVQRALTVDELRTANRTIDQKYQELNTLFELGKEFNRVLDVENVVRLLTFSLMGQVGVSRYAVCLIRNGMLEIAAARLEAADRIPAAAASLAGLRNAMLVSDLTRQKRYAESAQELQALDVQAVIPMVIQNQQRGLILLGPRMKGEAYRSRDLQFLSSLGNLASISVENARLFQEALEKQRLEEDLKIAREIQQGLLPLTLPPMPGYDMAAVNVSSRQVGGDYYDALLLPDGRLAIAIGDVSGKGTPAALLMSNVQAALRALVPLGLSMPETTARINELTCQNTGGDKFITLFWGILDPLTDTLTFVNAGHNHPFLLRRDGTVERLERGGMILGVIPSAGPYEEGRVHLGGGDLLFLFTDGVSEAMNASGEDLTEERLQELLAACGPISALDVIACVRRGIESHVQGAPQADDLTMLVLRKSAPA